MRSTVVESDAAFFTKDPGIINIGRGSVTIAYRPIAFEGRIAATELAIGVGFGDRGVARPIPAEPIDPLASGARRRCPDPPTRRAAAGLRRAARGRGLRPRGPDMAPIAAPRPAGRLYAGRRAGPLRRPDLGTVLVRFVNDYSEPVGFQFDVVTSAGPSE